MASVSEAYANISSASLGSQPRSNNLGVSILGGRKVTSTSMGSVYHAKSRYRGRRVPGGASRRARRRRSRPPHVERHRGAAPDGPASPDAEQASAVRCPLTEQVHLRRG